LGRLNRYLVITAVKILLLCEFAGIIVFSTIEFFDHIDVYTASLTKLVYSMAYIGLKIPYFFNLILPLAFLISILILIILMIRSNEVIIVRTAGISTLTFMKPFLCLSLVLVLLSFVLSEWAIPLTSSTADYIYQVKIKQEQSFVYFKNDKIWFKRGNTVANIDFYDTKKDVIKGLTFLELSPTYAITRRIDARQGVWTHGEWVFSDVIERGFTGDGIASKQLYPELKGIIKEPPSVFKIVEKNPEEMSYKELKRYINRLKRNGHDTRRYLVDLHSKIAFPFINLVMVLAGFSVGLRYAKTKHIAKGVFTGILVGILYWFFHNISLALGYKEIFPPLFAAWISNFLFVSLGGIGVVTLRT
jgi:lipopolysaccharide export system permease protein